MIPEQAPGHPSWLGVLTEVLTGQLASLDEGAAQARDLRTDHWTGPASEAYDAAREAHAAEWVAAVDLHAAIKERVDGHSTFIGNLQRLWHEPADRPHLHQLWHTATEALAAELLERAEALDRLGAATPPGQDTHGQTAAIHGTDPQPEVDLDPREPDPRQEPGSDPQEADPQQELGSDPPEPEPDPPEPDAVEPDPAVEPDLVQSFTAIVAHEIRVAEELRSAIRVERIRWDL